MLTFCKRNANFSKINGILALQEDEEVFATTPTTSTIKHTPKELIQIRIN